MTTDGCRMAFMEEMAYWNLDEMTLEQCCHQKYLLEREVLEQEQVQEEPIETFLPGKIGEIQKKVR